MNFFQSAFMATSGSLIRIRLSKSFNQACIRIIIFIIIISRLVHFNLPSKVESKDLVLPERKFSNFRIDSELRYRHHGNMTINLQNHSTNQQLPQSTGLAIVMFTHLNTTERFDNLLFPSLETWWKNQTDPLYIVLTHQWKKEYANMCLERNCSQFYPIWVDCPEGKFGESPCCKQEKGLLGLPKDYEWTIFADDDMYFKIDDLMRYLTEFLNVDPAVPYIVTSGGVTAKFLGEWGYKGTNGAYKCSSKDEFRYPWGQPVIYSRAALELVTPGFRAGGLVKQCNEFLVTHDAGNSIFHWMYQIPDYAIKFHMFPGDRVKSEAFGVHGINRLIKKLKHIFTMKEVHIQALQSKPTKFLRYMRVRHERKGFLETETFEKFGHPSKWGDDWHVMPRSDCMDEEMRDNEVML